MSDCGSPWSNYHNKNTIITLKADLLNLLDNCGIKWSMNDERVASVYIIYYFQGTRSQIFKARAALIWLNYTVYLVLSACSFACGSRFHVKVELLGLGVLGYLLMPLPFRELLGLSLASKVSWKTLLETLTLVLKWRTQPPSIKYNCVEITYNVFFSCEMRVK